MGVIRKIRAYSAFAFYLCSLVVLAAPHLYLLIAWHALAVRDTPRRRIAVAGWQMFWGNALSRATFRVMGIETSFDVPSPFMHEGRPLIVVANHPSGPLDGFIIMRMFASMGRNDFRSIMKREVLKAPVIGRSCKETECAFLARGNDRSNDLASIERCGRVAFLDRACVVIFPEGTRFRGPKEGSGLSRVLPPKGAGLRALMAAMPGAPVLSVTIAWDREIRNTAHTSSSIASYVDAKVAIEARLLEDIDPARVEEWLKNEWRRKDRALSAHAS